MEGYPSRLILKNWMTRMALSASVAEVTRVLCLREPSDLSREKTPRERLKAQTQLLALQ
jgi:hypothetical protein